uniref:Uncharacterized protein n=1 Tax=Oryza glumipatula TaxID=40148 RepID=A0A0E0ABM2_9ORYZ
MEQIDRWIDTGVRGIIHGCERKEEESVVVVACGGDTGRNRSAGARRRGGSHARARGGRRCGLRLISRDSRRRRVTAANRIQSLHYCVLKQPQVEFTAETAGSTNERGREKQQPILERSVSQSVNSNTAETQTILQKTPKTPNRMGQTDSELNYKKQITEEHRSDCKMVD